MNFISNDIVRLFINRFFFQILSTEEVCLAVLAKITSELFCEDISLINKTSLKNLLIKFFEIKSLNNSLI